MKFSCDSILLAKAAVNIQRTVSSKSTIPAVEGILIECSNDVLTLTGYDLDMGMKTQVECNTMEDGSLILNAKHFCDILRFLPSEEVLIEDDDRHICKIKSGNAEYTIIGIDAGDYPDMPTVSNNEAIEIGNETLRDMIRKTVFSVSTSERNPVHCGIKFEIAGGKITLVAVDGARLAVRKEDISYAGGEKAFVVPTKAVNEILKLNEGEDENVKIYLSKRYISFIIGNYTIFSRLLEGNFIDYNAAIPKSAQTDIIVDTKVLISSIERTSLIITDRSSPVKCAAENSVMKFSCVTSVGTANDRLAVEMTGKDIEIGFNNKFLLDALRAVDDEKVHIEMNSASQPIIIKPTDGSDKYLFLVLPVRI